MLECNNFQNEMYREYKRTVVLFAHLYYQACYQLIFQESTPIVQSILSLQEYIALLFHHQNCNSVSIVLIITFIMESIINHYLVCSRKLSTIVIFDFL